MKQCRVYVMGKVESADVVALQIWLGFVFCFVFNAKSVQPVAEAGV